MTGKPSSAASVTGLANRLLLKENRQQPSALMNTSGYLIHNNDGGVMENTGSILQTPTGGYSQQYPVGITNSHNMTMPKNYSRYAASQNNLMGAGGSTGPSQNGDNM
jgi:hypothetical protein